MPTALISSTPMESMLILDLLTNRREAEPGITTGKFKGKAVVHITCGIGIANAARGTTILTERFKPGRIILFGIGGAYPGSGLRKGHLALAKKEIYADSGVYMPGGRLEGFKPAGIALLDKGTKRFYNEFPLDNRELKLAREIIKDASVGAFTTVAACTGTAGRARRIRESTGALCENMEGAAVAQVCMAVEVPLIEIRGISNIVGVRDKAKWDIELAARNCQLAVVKLLG